MVELIVYPKPEDVKLINHSPFCSKTEIFLRLAKIDYVVNNFNGNPGKFPKSKLPAIQYNKEIIADSSFIQKYLEKEFNVDLDAHLSLAQKAQGFAFAKMAEEYLYWSIVHERWLIDENWVRLRDGLFSHIPGLIRNFVAGIIRNNVRKAAIGHGMSRHSDKDILELGRECIRTLSNFLEQKKFILGDKVSSYDASVYAFVSSVLHSPLGPELKKEALKYSNLVAYDQRMFEAVGF